MKVSSRKAARMVVNRMMKSSFVKVHQGFYGAMDYYVGIDNYYMFCDGVRFLCLDEDFGFPHISLAFSVQKYLKCSFRPACEIDIGELKEVVASSERNMFEVGDTCFDARFLLQMLEALQTNLVYLGARPTDCALFKNNKGEFGGLMPLRASNKK